MKKNILVLFLLVFFLAGPVCFAENETSVTKFTAISNARDIYYLTTTQLPENDEFSIFYARSNDPTLCYYLRSYQGSPLINAVYNSSMIAFYENGTVLGYAQAGSVTYPNFDNSYKPLSAVALVGDLYLLAAGTNNFTIFKLEGNQWETIRSFEQSETINGCQMFSYTNNLYLAFSSQQGKLICKTIKADNLVDLPLITNQSEDNLRLVDVLTVNNSVVFILSQENGQGHDYYSAIFANDQLGTLAKLDLTDLPILATNQYSFISCGIDMALAVYNDNQIVIQKYDVTGNKVGDIITSYDLTLSDISDNKYLQVAAITCIAILITTITVRFRRAMTGGPVPATACGLPSPIGFRAAAFAIDFILMLFVVDVVMGVLDLVNLIDKTKLMFVLQNTPNPLVTSGRINLNIEALMTFYLLIYLVLLFYFTLFEWLLLATPGKLIFGLKVVDSVTLAPVRISFWRILLRNVYRILESIPYVLPLIMVIMIISPRRQRCGDMIANTTVVLSRIIKKNGTKIDKMA